MTVATSCEGRVWKGLAESDHFDQSRVIVEEQEVVGMCGCLSEDEDMPAFIVRALWSTTERWTPRPAASVTQVDVAAWDHVASEGTLFGQCLVQEFRM